MGHLPPTLKARCEPRTTKTVSAGSKTRPLAPCATKCTAGDALLTAHRGPALALAVSIVPCMRVCSGLKKRVGANLENPSSSLSPPSIPSLPLSLLTVTVLPSPSPPSHTLLPKTTSRLLESTDNTSIHPSLSVVFLLVSFVSVVESCNDSAVTAAALEVFFCVVFFHLGCC